MNRIAKLIKAKTIDFTQVLIQNYKAIGLNETNAMVVAKLYYLKEENDNFLELEKLAKEVTISIDALGDMIIDLVNKGYIELELDNTGKETFSIDGVIEKIALVLDKGSNDEILSERNELLSLIVNYVETTFKKTCSSSDLIIINAWLDSNYDYNDIKNAVLKSFQLGKYNLKYADAILANNNSRKEVSTDDIDPELKALLDGAYVKK